MSRAFRSRAMALEPLGRICSNQTRDGSCDSPVRPPLRQRAGHDINVSVAVEVPGLRAEHTGQIGEPMLHEWELPLVLEPLDAVIRLDDLVVECVTVRQQHVQVAVAVESTT